MKKGFSPIIVLLVLLIPLVGLAAYYLGTKKSSSPIPPPIVSTPTSTQPVNQLTVTESPVAESDLETETIPYTPHSDWNTYTDSVAGFSIQYDPNKKPPYNSYTKLGETSPGKSAYFQACSTATGGPTAGKEVCILSVTINVNNDYSGGSRREWLLDYMNFFGPVYYKNWIIDGKKALLAIDGNTGGSSYMAVAIPKGNMMVVYSTPASWNPETRELPDLTFHKEILSTFKFLE